MLGTFFGTARMVAPRSATRDTKDAQGLGPRSALDGICRLSLLFVGGRSIEGRPPGFANLSTRATEPRESPRGVDEK
jgi:hypothetical protein